ncbi:programmed cell death protein 2 [Biscogniauxia marginata]|nr:programmed cell death protein 2 [Biscogniauxia marginata]
MAPYDSDSSEGEGEDFTETNVLLGYASKDPEDDSITRLGGRPDWLDDATPPSAALARCKICRDLMVLLLQLNGELPDRFPGHERRLYVFACRKKGCRRREGSVRALRGVRVAPDSKTLSTQAQQEKPKPKPTEETKPSPPSNLGETLFGATTMGSSFAPSNPFSNPFSTANSSSSSPGVNPFASNNPYASPPAPAQQPVAKDTTQPEPEPSLSTSASATKIDNEIKSLPKTFAETLSLNSPQSASPPSPPEPWPPESSQPRPYPISYLSDAEYETLDPTPPPVSQATTTQPIDMDSSPADTPPGKGAGGKNNSREDRDVFESSMDAAFQKFADRLSQNPEQCIRYEFGGHPLLYSRADAVGRRLGEGGGGAEGGMPRCPSCGAPRAFEVQLCPRAIAELEADDTPELLEEDGMDWGTVIVGVCERDCCPRGAGQGGAEAAYLEEWVGVQWEELSGGGGSGGKGR